MARRKQTRGKCTFCERKMTRGGLVRHLAACPERKKALQAANEKPGQTETLYHLQVQDAWGGDYWLHIEMKGSASLNALDRYLRAIWLECCGHLSRFSVGGGWQGEEVAKRRQADQVFEPGLELTHIYDFGTSSITTIKVVDERVGKPLTARPIFLMARNDPPEITCMECDRLAAWLCMECVYEHNALGALCDEHVEDHPHQNYGEPFPLVNSPRTGMCGYVGPAEPPY